MFFTFREIQYLFNDNQFNTTPSLSAGIDDAESECGLDQGVDFDWIMKNEGDGSQLEEQLATGLLSIAKEKPKED